MRFENDPEGMRLPIKLDTATNGEYAPIPLAPAHHHARRLAFDVSDGQCKTARARPSQLSGLCMRSRFIAACDERRLRIERTARRVLSNRA